MNAILLVLAATLSGTVTDNRGQPVSGAAVSIQSTRNTTTDSRGAFSLDVPDGAYEVRVVHPGFRVETTRARTDDPVTIALAPAFAETMVVSAIRADDVTPVTKTDVSHAQIEREYHGQDVPLLLRDTPSVDAWAESGVGGSGYSYISLRGISSTRLNFTLDGVPLADSEDMGTYFVDFPDLARSLESIQIQRGVGTSTFGTASFGGSVNMESVNPAGQQSVEATLAAGSFGNEQASVGFHSGTLPGGVALYTRVSYLENDGFREHSGTRQRNVFLSGTKPVGDAQLRFTGFAGHESQQLSFYATDADTVKSNVRANPLSPEERDSFGCDLAQVEYVRPLGNSSDMTASAYYQRGYGWYRLFDFGTDDLRQYGLDGMLLGSMVTYSHTSGPLTTNAGVHVNRFRRDHTRNDVRANTRDYANYGVKDEGNAFAKLTWNAGPWHLYGDAQVRYAGFDYHGDVPIDSISWTFFNPKAGARFDLSPRSSVYASAGLTTREPTRNDLFLGEDNPSIAHDLHAVKPERVVDFEAGWTLRTTKVDVTANVYAMQFHNEIASTGELSEIGLALRRNVDRSYRRGIELDLGWQIAPALRLKTTANVSRNRISEWTQFYDVYDADFTWIDSRPITSRNVEPLLTPSLLINQGFDYTPTSKLRLGGTARYVGRSFLDNTNDVAFAAPSFLVVDANASYAFLPKARLSLQVNNLFNRERVYPSGYSYRFFVDGARSGTAYYYPQAGRNAVVLLDFKL